MRRSWWGWCLVGLLVGLPRPVAGQTTDPLNATIQFNFSNPGARSLALGGAFTGRADDATAVYANPAGLLQLFDTEVSVDWRGWEYSSQFLDGGVQASPGSFDGLRYGETSDRLNGLSFVSAMYPSRGGRWVMGVYFHQLANFRAEVRSGVAEVIGDQGQLIGTRALFGLYDLEISTYGAAAAWRLGRSFGLGASVSIATMDLAARSERSDNREQPPRQFIEEDLDVCCRFAPRDDIIRVELQSSDGADNQDISFTLGALWQSSSQRHGVPFATVGAVARFGPEFGFFGNGFFRTVGRGVRSYPPTTEFEGCTAAGCPGRFKIPDVYGLGISLRPSTRWVLSLDLNRVLYSQLIDTTLELIRPNAELALGEAGPVDDFELDDGTEVRLGAELGVFRRRALPDIFVRVGLWNDPDHETRYVGDDRVLRGIWAPGSDEMHYTAGIGLRFRRIQLDAAVDVSERVSTASLSSVYYLRR